MISSKGRRHPRRITKRVDRYGDDDKKETTTSEDNIKTDDNTNNNNDIIRKKRKLSNDTKKNFISHLLSITQYPNCLNNYNDTIQTQKPQTIPLLQKLNSLESFSIKNPSLEKWDTLLLAEEGKKYTTYPPKKIKELKRKGYVLTQNYLHSYNLVRVSSKENYIVLLDHGYIVWILYSITHLLVTSKLVLDEKKEVVDLFLLEGDDGIRLIVCYGDSMDLYVGGEWVWRVEFEGWVDTIDVCESGIIGSNTEKDEGVPAPFVFVSLEGVVSVLQPKEDQSLEISNGCKESDVVNDTKDKNMQSLEMSNDCKGDNGAKENVSLDSNCNQEKQESMNEKSSDPISSKENTIKQDTTSKTTNDNTILTGRGIAIWAKDGKSIYLSTYQKSQNTPILLQLSHPSLQILHKIPLPNPPKFPKPNPLLTLNPSQTLLATVVPNIINRWTVKKNQEIKANGYAIQVYNTTTLQFCYSFGDGLQLHGHAVHWQSIRFLNDTILYSIPSSYREPKELQNYIHVWDSNTPYFNSSIPKEKFIGPEEAGLEDLTFTKNFWVCIVNQECYFKRKCEIKSSFSGRMYPPGFLISEGNCLEFVEDEDALDIVDEEEDDGEVEVECEVKENEIIDITSNTPLPNYIPCYTIAPKQLEQQSPITKNQNNTSLLSLFPKSYDYLNQTIEKDPVESTSITSVRGNKQKTAYSLYVQPKLRTRMYTRQIPKSYPNLSNTTCFACKGRFMPHSCGVKYTPTTAESEEQEAKSKKQFRKVLTLEEMEEKRRIKIEKRRIYDAKRRERKRAEKLALLKQQEDMAGAKSDTVGTPQSTGKVLSVAKKKPVKTTPEKEEMENYKDLLTYCDDDTNTISCLESANHALQKASLVVDSITNILNQVDNNQMVTNLSSLTAANTNHHDTNSTNHTTHIITEHHPHPNENHPTNNHQKNMILDQNSIPSYHHPPPPPDLLQDNHSDLYYGNHDYNYYEQHEHHNWTTTSSSTPKPRNTASFSPILKSSSFHEESPPPHQPLDQHHEYTHQDYYEHLPPSDYHHHQRPDHPHNSNYPNHMHHEYSPQHQQHYYNGYYHQQQQPQVSNHFYKYNNASQSSQPYS